MWTFKDKNNKHIEASADNIINELLTPKIQKPRSDKENRETEKRYLDQLGLVVKCYYKDGLNIINMTPNYKK